mgnify:CR=1 FL=1
MKYFWINLDSCHKRREKMMEQFKEEKIATEKNIR